MYRAMVATQESDFGEQQFAIFQKQLKGELTFEECWKLQTELLERNFKQDSKDDVKVVEKNIEVYDVSDDSDEEKVFEAEDVKEEKFVKEELEIMEDNIDRVKAMPENKLTKVEDICIKSEKKEKQKEEAKIKSEKEVRNDDSREKNGIKILTLNSKEERSHACHECNFRAKEFHTLKVHIEMTHVNLRFYCTICQYTTKERYPLKGHLKLKHGVSLEDSNLHTKQECGICYFQGSVEEFEEHINIFHAGFKMILARGIKRTRRKNKICEFCEKNFTGKKFASAMLRSHIELAHMKNGYKCSKCGFENNLKHAVYVHIGEKHLTLNLEKRDQKMYKRSNTKYKCRVCDLLTDSHYIMLTHMKEKHEEHLKTVKQAVRGRRSANDVKSGPKRFECPTCSYKTNMYGNLKIHVETHIDSMFSCNICEVTKKKRSEVVFHIKREHQVKLKLNYKGWCQKYVTCFCKDCNFLGSSTNYDEHLEELHNIPKSMRKPRNGKLSSGESKGSHIFQCGKCEKTYITRTSLKQHIAIEHLETVYNCDICDKSYRKVLDVKEHMKTYHRENTDSVTTYCGECQTESPNDLLYKHIMRVHRSLYTRKYLDKDGVARRRSRKSNNMAALVTFNFAHLNIRGSCYFCQSSLTKTETDNHILNFHMKAFYICKKCGDEKPTRNSIHVHIRKAHVDNTLHFSEVVNECLVHVCGLCDFNGNSSQFAEHVKVHEQEILSLDYTHRKCNYCDFKHVAQKKLEKHFAKIHDLTPFSCDECAFKSKTKQGLVDHYRFIHPEYRYKCKLCRFESAHFAALWRHHSDIHEQAKNYFCQICSARFKRNEFLQHHLKRKHGF